MMRAIGFFTIAAVMISVIAPVAAQSNYPERNIRLIYGFPPGSDAIVRIYADKLSIILGKPVVVDNITGAGGNIATDRVAKAPPDGYTISILAAANVIINPFLYKKLPYNPTRELIRVTQLFGYPNLLLINNEVAAKTVQDLVALARAQPGKLTYGHGGVGTTTQLSAELFKSAAHLDIQGVPFRGPQQIVTDMMAGRITMTFAPPQLPLMQDRKVHALAVTSRARAPFAPDLPTMEESGFNDFDISVWFGLFVPAGTPRVIVERLNSETVKIMNSPDVRTRAIDLGLLPLSNTPAEFAEIIKNETPFWTRVIRDAGVKQIE